jgi:hypothetical protein
MASWDLRADAARRLAKAAPSCGARAGYFQTQQRGLGHSGTATARALADLLDRRPRNRRHTPWAGGFIFGIALRSNSASILLTPRRSLLVPILGDLLIIPPRLPPSCSAFDWVLGLIRLGPWVKRTVPGLSWIPRGFLIRPARQVLGC